jgi:hypothetical protein
MYHRKFGKEECETFGIINKDDPNKSMTDAEKKKAILEKAMELNGLRIIECTKDYYFKDNEHKALSFQSFEMDYADWTVPITKITPDGNGGVNSRPTTVKIASFIKDMANSVNLKRPEKFKPGTKGDTDKFWNSFKGFLHQGNLGNGTLPIYEHIYRVIANYDINNFRWIMKWIANIFQDPENKPMTAIIVSGLEGTGKSIIFNQLMSKLLGEYHACLNFDPFESQFNNVLEDKLFIVFDEGSWDFRSKTIGKFKNFITEPTQSYELKGYDRYTKDCYTRVAFTTNHENAFVVSETDRRFAVFTASNEFRQDHVYFGRLKECINNDAIIHNFMADLMAWDDSETDITTVPETKERKELQEASKNPQDLFIDDMSQSAEFLPRPKYDSQGNIIGGAIKIDDNKDIYQVSIGDLVDKCNERSRGVNNIKVTALIKKLIQKGGNIEVFSDNRRKEMFGKKVTAVRVSYGEPQNTPPMGTVPGGDNEENPLEPQNSDQNTPQNSNLENFGVQFGVPGGVLNSLVQAVSECIKGVLIPFTDIYPMNPKILDKIPSQNSTPPLSCQYNTDGVLGLVGSDTIIEEVNDTAEVQNNISNELHTTDMKVENLFKDALISYKGSDNYEGEDYIYFEVAYLKDNGECPRVVYCIYAKEYKEIADEFHKAVYGFMDNIEKYEEFFSKNEKIMEVIEKDILDRISTYNWV